jgi:hypothetical protein
VNFDAEGISYLNLPTLVELKLASGMTNPGRLKDLSDVLELIKVLDLPIDFADQLNAFVKSKYKELWMDAKAAEKFGLVDESEYWGIDKGDDEPKGEPTDAPVPE